MLNRYTLAYLVTACVFTCLVSQQRVDAQNLLTNGNLEGVDGFQLPPGACSKNNNWYYVYDCIPEIEPPTWWYPFWNTGPTPVDPSTDYRRPEFRVYGWPDGPHYSFDGQKYLVFFGFYGAIDAGIYQQVQVTPGRPYEFSAQVFAWSNCGADKEGPSGEECNTFPPDQAVFRAGIDPTGGTDYASSSIIWSDGLSVYDAYQPISVTAEASASTITVFIRCTFYHNYIMHNDAHVDAFQLFEVGTELLAEPQQITHSVHFLEASTSQHVVQIDRAGSDILNVAATADEDWITVSPTAGVVDGSPLTLDVAIDASGLTMGEHVGSIELVSAEASNSPLVVPVVVSIVSVGPDLDRDGDVDQTDFGLFQVCVTGQGVAAQGLCAEADFRGDGDVDLDDFAAMQNCFAGAGIPAVPGCMTD